MHCFFTQQFDFLILPGNNIFLRGIFEEYSSRRMPILRLLQPVSESPFEVLRDGKIFLTLLTNSGGLLRPGKPSLIADKKKVPNFCSRTFFLTRNLTSFLPTTKKLLSLSSFTLDKDGKGLPLEGWKSEKKSRQSQESI